MRFMIDERMHHGFEKDKGGKLLIFWPILHIADMTSCPVHHFLSWKLKLMAFFFVENISVKYRRRLCSRSMIYSTLPNLGFDIVIVLSLT